VSVVIVGYRCSVGVHGVSTPVAGNPTDQMAVLGPEHNHCKNRKTVKVGQRAED